MKHLSSLEQRLAVLLERASESLAEERRASEAQMLRIAPLRARFERAAGLWLNDLVLTRLQALARLLPHGGHVYHTPGTLMASLKFPWSREMGGAAALNISISPSAGFERATMLVHPLLVPMLSGHPPASMRDFDVEGQDPHSLADFLDDGLVTFAEAYLRARDPSSPYQRESFSTDPVCGMTVRHSVAAAICEHDGRRFYFCAASCADEFRRDPDRYTTFANGRIGSVS